MNSKVTQKVRRESIKNPYETNEDVVSKLKTTVKDELSRDWKIAMAQMLGIKDEAREMVQDDMYFGTKEGPVSAGDLNEGVEIIFPKKEKTVNIEPGIDYLREIVHAETRINRKEQTQLEAKIQEIVIELKKLSQSSKELELEFKDITVATLPTTPGKYHLNFFEWMLITIQNARMRVEDSAAWVNVIAGKKGKKDYWSLAKAHGTSFSLSGERVVAQQTG